MYQFISIGDITIDLYFSGESLTIEKDRFSLAKGGKYYTDFFHQGLGGSGANISIHAANLGLNSAALSKVGENAFKNVIVQGLIRKTVSTEFLTFERQHISISSILLGPQGERTIIKYSDPKDHLPVSPTIIERISKIPMIFMGNHPDISVKERADFIESIKTQENHIAVNFGSKDCQKGVKYVQKILNLANIIILNKYEFCELTGQNPEKIKLETNQHESLNLSDQLLVVTDSSNGAYVYTKDDVYFEEAVKVKKVVDVTGAGDAFSAAFLVKYHSTKDPKLALKSGVDYSATILGKIGAN